jgi:hypothetical protein
MTSEQWASIQEELQTLLKIKQKKGEDLESYARRLANGANKVDDDVWETITEDTQEWINLALEAGDSKDKSIPLPEGAVSKKAAEAKKPAAAKAAKKTAAAKATESASNSGEKRRRGRPARFKEATALNLPKENPHRSGTNQYKRFEQLKPHKTVGAALEAGVEPAYLRYLHIHEIINLD